MLNRGVVITIILSVAIFSGVYYFFQSSRLVIKGEFESGGGELIYLDLYENSEIFRIDSTEIDDQGRFRFVVNNALTDPMLYMLVSGWNTIPLLGSRSEKIKVEAGANPALDYTVEGSEESELLRSFYQPFLEQSTQLKRIAAQYARAQSRGGDRQEEYAQEYSELYRQIKRNQMRFIVANKGSIASIYALMQMLPGDKYLFSRTSDLIYKRTVVEGVESSYPNSSYLLTLRREIELHETQDSVLREVKYVDFPELLLTDMYGDKVSLSALKGRVILLDFWSAELKTSNQNNAEMKELYSNYSSEGFEIYQVGIDTSKSIWLATIQKQHLPWISVSDLRGGNSPALGLYNVTQLPSNVIIGKSGEIVGRDIYGAALEQTIRTELAKSVK